MTGVGCFIKREGRQKWNKHFNPVYEQSIQMSKIIGSDANSSVVEDKKSHQNSDLRLNSNRSIESFYDNKSLISDRSAFPIWNNSVAVSVQDTKYEHLKTSEDNPFSISQSAFSHKSNFQLAPKKFRETSYIQSERSKEYNPYLTPVKSKTMAYKNNVVDVPKLNLPKQNLPKHADTFTRVENVIVEPLIEHESPIKNMSNPNVVSPEITHNETRLV